MADWPSGLGGAPLRSLEIFAGDSVAQSIDEHSTTAGLQAVAARARFARWCYGCDSIAGIDLQRPARFFWLEDDHVLGIIPLGDRSRFLNEFTGLPLTGTDLIRTGEREGTVVYAYNGDDGIYEYRLLIRDGTAYLAPSVAACRALAGLEWPSPQGDEPAMLYIDRSPRFQLEHNPLFSELPETVRAPIQAVAQAMADRLAPECDALRWSLRSEEGGRIWDLQVALGLRNGSDTASWLSMQQNNASRLLPLLPEDGGLLQLHGKLQWNGALERMSEHIIGALSQNLAPGLRPEGWSEHLRLWLAQIDKQGAFALQLRQVEGKLRLLHAMRHQDVAGLALATEGLQRLYQTVLTGAGMLVNGDAGDEMLGDHPFHWLTISQGDEQLFSRAELTAEKTVLGAMGAVDHKALADDCQAMVDHLHQRGAPEGEVALLALHLRADRWLVRWADARSVPHGELEAVPLMLSLISDGSNSLRLECRLPLQDLARANNAVGLRAPDWRAILPP